MRKKKDTKAPKLQNEKKKVPKKKRKKTKKMQKKSYLHQSCSTAPPHLISGVCEKTNKQTNNYQR